MNAPFRRRGECPSLSRPMPTGDGLLVRLLPAQDGLTADQFAGLAEAARCFGNGLLEITRRGSLQIRGLSAGTVAPLNDAVAALGIPIRTGLPVDLSPLGGLDGSELADPRPLASAIRAGAEPLLARLGPKVSVVVDGGGGDWLHEVKADIRFQAERQSHGTLWRVSLAGDAASATPLGLYDEAGARDAGLSALSAIAGLGREGRARDLVGREARPPAVSSSGPSGISPDPFQAVPLRDSRQALPVAIPFGSIPARNLSDLVRGAADLGVSEFRLAPKNMVLLLCASPAVADSAREFAAKTGFITTMQDRRRFIVACAGAPACASGWYETRALAARVAASPPGWLDGSFRLHLSGCAKRCAEPAGPSVALIGGPEGATPVANGISVTPQLGQDLACLSQRLHS